MDKNEIKRHLSDDVYIESQPLAFVHKVWLNRDIGDPRDHEPLLSLLGNASENDTFHFYINTCGGRKDTMVELLSAMRQTRANLVGEITSNCMSAGTFIFLTCDEFIVNSHIEFMAHDALYGSGGKRSDVANVVEFNNKLLPSMIREIYEGFFTEEEINRILDGKEYYLEAHEVADRLEKRDKYLEDKLSDKTSLPPIEQVKAQVESLLEEGLPKKEIKNIIKQAVAPFGIKVNVNQKIEDILKQVEESVANNEQ